MQEPSPKIPSYRRFAKEESRPAHPNHALAQEAGVAIRVEPQHQAVARDQEADQGAENARAR